MAYAHDDDRYSPVPCGTCNGLIDEQYHITMCGSVPCHSWCASGDRYCRSLAKRQGGQRLERLSKYSRGNPVAYGVRLQDLNHTFGTSRRTLRERNLAITFMQEVIDYVKYNKIENDFLVRGCVHTMVRSRIWLVERACQCQMDNSGLSDRVPGVELKSFRAPDTEENKTISNF